MIKMQILQILYRKKNFNVEKYKYVAEMYSSHASYKLTFCKKSFGEREIVHRVDKKHLQKCKQPKMCKKIICDQYLLQ